MAKWVKPLSQVASKSAASRNLKDEEVVQALMAQAGVQDKVQKPTFLENLSAALGAFEWSDDALKALQEGQSLPEAVGNYLVDIPRTLAGVALGKRDWVDPDEGHGVELMKYLGIEEKVPQYIFGTLADIFEPSMAISSTIKGGSKLTKLGASFLDDVAKVGVKNPDEGVKIIAKTFGKEAGESAAKRLAANDDIMSIASDFMRKSGKSLGFVEDVAPGAYLGLSAESGRKIAEGTIPSYIAKLVDSPVTAPFEIGWDVAKKTGLSDTKLAKGLSKGLEKNVLDAFVYQKGLKGKGEGLEQFGSKISGINTASEYASGQKLRKLENFFNNLPKEQKQEFFEKGIADYVEIGGGLPQKTTVAEFVDTLKEAKLIVKSDYDEIMKRLDPVVAQTPFGDVPKLLKQKTAYGTNLLEDQLGYAYKFVPARLNAMSKQATKWNELLNEIGYKGNKVIETAKDVQRFRDAIKRSRLDEQSKEFYNRYIADIFEANLDIEGKRTALGLADLGPGYIRRSYNIKSVNDLPKDIKKNLISRQERMLPSLADLEVYNEFSPTKLELQTGARGLVNQISYKAGQDQAVKQTYDAYNSLIEQVKMGMMPDFAVKGMGDVPKTWEKTGVPMLDEAGILVNKDTWDVIKDSNKFLLGETDYNEVFKAFDKINSWWRGWTTAWTVKLPKGVNLPGLGNEIPLNPAYFVRNWMNNKMSMALYAGMNPAEIPTRMFQAKKVWNYLSKGAGGDEKIGNYTVKQIGDAFAQQGGLGGTNVEDILKSMGEYEGALGAVKGALGGGELAQKIEVSDKIAIFLDQKLKNIGDVKAMDKVRFALFDYSQLTDFELEKVKPLFAFYCVPDSAEILTRDGWKHYQDLEIKEEVLSYNRKKEVMEWTPLKGIATFEHDQELYEFANKRYSFMFTDEHKWVTKQYDKTEALKKANQLNTGDSLRVLAPYVSKGESILTPEQARLLGWCLTDSCIRTRKNIIRRDFLRVTLCQHPSKFLSEVKEIAGGKPSKPHPTSGTVYVPVLKERLEPIREYLLDRSKLPGLVTRLSKEALKAMFDAMYKADGTVSLRRGARDSMFFASQDKDKREIFRLIATLLGYRTSISKRGCYLSKRQYLKVAYNLKRKHYKGVVWCPQTDNETWVMRQNGFITITGNTWNRKNIESLFTTLVKDPKRVKMFDKIFKGFKQLADEQGTDIREILPDYLQGAYSIITGDKGQVGALYGFGTNIEAAGELFGRDLKESAQNLFGQLAPNIRIPLELVADFNFFKGKPISEDTSAYSMRNLPENAKELMGIQGTSFTTDDGKEVTTYKMNPTVKYMVENFRPATSMLKLFNIASDEGVDNEMFLDLLNYITGIRYQQYDTEYLRRQLENERYKQRMQMLMDEGYVSEYKNYYIPKEK